MGIGRSIIGRAASALRNPDQPAAGGYLSNKDEHREKDGKALNIIRLGSLSQSANGYFIESTGRSDLSSPYQCDVFQDMPDMLYQSDLRPRIWWVPRGGAVGHGLVDRELFGPLE